MSYLLSLITNDLKLLPDTMTAASGMVAMIDRIDLGWGGVGSYQDGRAVVQRRRFDANMSFRHMISSLHTKRVLAHVQDRPETAFSSNDTQPFRYKNWLFALSGTLGGGGLLAERTLERIPDYLRQNIQGSLPPELVFHLFLAYLHEDARLPVQRSEPAFIRRALSRTVRDLPGLAEQGGEIGFSILLSNGEHLFGATHGRNLYYRTVDGVRVTDPSTGRVADHHWVRATFMANFLPDGEEAKWQALGADHMVVCDDHFALTTIPLSVD